MEGWNEGVREWRPTVHTVRVDTVHLAGSGPQTPTLTLGVGTEALHLHFSPLSLAKDPLHLHFSPLLVNHGPLSHAHCLGHWLLLWNKNSPNDTDMGSKSQMGNIWVRAELQIPFIVYFGSRLGPTNPFQEPQAGFQWPLNASCPALSTESMPKSLHFRPLSTLVDGPVPHSHWE